MPHCFTAAPGEATILVRLIPFHSGYQVPFAAALKAQTGTMTDAVGLIDRPYASSEPAHLPLD
jgi:hypothetical protein